MIQFDHGYGSSVLKNYTLWQFKIIIKWFQIVRKYTFHTTISLIYTKDKIESILRIKRPNRT